MQQAIFVTASPNFLTLLQCQRWVLFKSHENLDIPGEEGTVRMGSPFLFVAHQLRRIDPEDGKREKSACWIVSARVEFSIN